MAELKYEITEHIAVLGESSRGWTKELNKVSWNDYPPKYDIREWSPDHARMGKGVTLSNEEFDALRRVINGEEINDPDGDDVNEEDII